MKLKTRYEQIKSMSKEELARFLCEFTETVFEGSDIGFSCDYCPASKYCRICHTGYVDWLDEKATKYENV